MYLRIIFFAWLIAIMFISLVDYSYAGWQNLAKGFGSGFWLHLVGYFIAGGLYFLAFRNKRLRVVIGTFFVLFMLGVLFEIIQIYVPHRTFDPKDIAANGLGLIGVYVGHKLIVRNP